MSAHLVEAWDRNRPNSCIKGIATNFADAMRHVTDSYRKGFDTMKVTHVASGKIVLKFDAKGFEDVKTNQD